MSDPAPRFRRDTEECSRCGAREVIPDARVTSAAGHETYVAAYGRPEATLFKKRKQSKVLARACTACGHLDFYAEDPGPLREAFDQANGRSDPG